MLSMVAMSTKPKQETYWNDRASFRTDGRAKDALSTVKNRVRRSDRLRFRGRKPTEEAIFASLCLWADAQEIDWLEGQLAPFMARIEELVRESELAKEGGRPEPAEFLKPGKKGGSAKTPSAPGPAVPTRAEKPKRRIS